MNSSIRTFIRPIFRGLAVVMVLASMVGAAYSLYLIANVLMQLLATRQLPNLSAVMPAVLTMLIAQAVFLIAKASMRWSLSAAERVEYEAAIREVNRCFEVWFRKCMNVGHWRS